MKLLVFVLSATALMLFYSCEDSDSNYFPKVYKYTSYDSTGNKIIAGYLWIDNIDSSKVKGRWQFNLISDCENIGPQICHGNFEGTVNMLGTLSLNLNPGMLDNNVLLDCSMRLPYRIDGRWSYVGISGVINWGGLKGEQLR